MRDQTNSAIDGAVKALPPAAVSFSDIVLGIPVEKWLTITLIIYTVLQILLLVRDRIILRREKKALKEKP
jgi:hypothetical protein